MCSPSRVQAVAIPAQNLQQKMNEAASVPYAGRRRSDLQSGRTKRQKSQSRAGYERLST